MDKQLINSPAEPYVKSLEAMADNLDRYTATFVSTYNQVRFTVTKGKRNKQYLFGEEIVSRSRFLLEMHMEIWNDRHKAKAQEDARIKARGINFVALSQVA